MPTLRPTRPAWRLAAVSAEWALLVLAGHSTLASEPSSLLSTPLRLLASMVAKVSPGCRLPPRPGRRSCLAWCCAQQARRSQLGAAPESWACSRRRLRRAGQQRLPGGLLGATARSSALAAPLLLLRRTVVCAREGQAVVCAAAHKRPVRPPHQLPHCCLPYCRPPPRRAPSRRR